MGILIAVIIFGIMIFVHELGHFVAARLCHVKVLEFSIGMGPKLFRHHSKKSDIDYSIRLLPIGGFCSMLGENDGSDDERALCNRPKYQRFIILVAGALMNIITAIIVMVVYVLNPNPLPTTTIESFTSENAPIYAAGALEGDRIIEIGDVSVRSYTDIFSAISKYGSKDIDLTVLRDGKKIKLDRFDFTTSEDSEEKSTVHLGFNVTEEEAYYSTTVSAFVSKDCPSYKSGLRQGDTIIRVGSSRISVYNDLVYAIMLDGTEPIDITVIRDGEEKVIKDVAFATEEQEGILTGVMDFVTATESKSFGTVISQAVNQSFSTIKIIYKSLYELITGKYGIKAMSGPVGTISVISEASSYGFRSILYLFVFISMNLGIFNLLPIPALDGGHILFLLIEAIRRKPLDKKYEAAFNTVGLLILLGLMVVVTVFDIGKLIG